MSTIQYLSQFRELDTVEGRDGVPETLLQVWTPTTSVGSHNREIWWDVVIPRRFEAHLEHQGGGAFYAT
jgi:hypothetical protein